MALFHSQMWRHIINHIGSKLIINIQNMSMFSMLRVKMVLKQITNELWCSAYVGFEIGNERIYLLEIITT